MLAALAAGSAILLADCARADDQVAFRELGTASYYGAELAGRRTASGERYDPAALTAAHPTLPFGSEVTVVALATGRRVTVEVNDRGPFTGGRSIDLSRRAAEAIGIVRKGVARVKLIATRDQMKRSSAARAPG
jgi:rare lipoprotein A